MTRAGFSKLIRNVAERGNLPRGIAVFALLLALLSVSCSRPARQASAPGEPLLVAAAANLSQVFEQAGADFTKQTGIPVKFNYGATVQLAQQIEHGAEFDLFAAADVEHVDQLVKSGAVDAASRAVYARGKLALWVPPGSRAQIKTLRDLTGDSVRFVAIANPDIAPYGAAAELLLRRQKLWQLLQARLVRAENVTAAKQMAATGNADAVFTALSLVIHDSGTLVPLDSSQLPPIDQALAIPARAQHTEAARKFADYLLHGAGRRLLQDAGYDLP